MHANHAYLALNLRCDGCSLNYIFYAPTRHPCCAARAAAGAPAAAPVALVTRTYAPITIGVRVLADLSLIVSESWTITSAENTLYHEHPSHIPLSCTLHPVSYTHLTLPTTPYV